MLVVFGLLGSAVSVAAAENSTGLTDSSSHLNLSTNSADIEYIGGSAYVKLLETLEDGSILDVTDQAKWTSANIDVAYPWEGRILAEGQGSTIISATYQGITQSLTVFVQGKKLDESKIPGSVLNPISMFTTQTERDSAITKASAMTNYFWTPTRKLTGWDGEKVFEANVAVQGIPYSQTAYQKDEIGFAAALSASDFYSSYTNYSGRTMPKYGNDCSGFLSFAWGISRKSTTDFVNGIANGTYPKVGTYTTSSPTTAQLTAAYALLQRGDAVVKTGHTFLIGANAPTSGFVYAYEQTPYFARFTIHNYSDLAANKYMPFSKN